MPKARPPPKRKAAGPEPGPQAQHADPEAVRALASLPCLGPTSARMLIEAGIASPADLVALGPAEVFRRLRFAHGRRVTVNFIYALEAAATGVPWRVLGEARKRELKQVARTIQSDQETGETAANRPRAGRSP